MSCSFTFEIIVEICVVTAVLIDLASQVSYFFYNRNWSAGMCNNSFEQC
jgi:hypothetical protein